MNFLSFFTFYQYTALNSRAVDGHQMYCGGLVLRKVSTTGSEILPTSLLIFTGGQKCEICRRFQHHSSLSRPRLKMQQDIRTLKRKCNAAMIASRLMSSPSLVKFSPRTRKRALSVVPHPLHPPPKKIARRKRAKSSITQPWIIRFRSNFVHSLNA